MRDRADPRQVHPLARLWRASRAALHLVRGVATTAFVFPRVSAQRRRTLTRRWSRRLLAILRVRTRLHGSLDVRGGDVLIVANHVSWLDIFVLNAYEPSRFVAKSELARWPVAGRLIRDTGTIFIERDRRHDTRRVNHAAAEALRRGDVVSVFPEGTTTDGSSLLRFHGALLQPIVEARGRVLPVAIRYVDARGRPSSAAAFVGEQSFVASFWQICGEPALAVDVHVSTPIDARGRHRRELADEARAVIASALGLPATSKAPGRSADPAAAPR